MTLPRKSFRCGRVRASRVAVAVVVCREISEQEESWCRARVGWKLHSDVPERAARGVTAPHCEQCARPLIARCGRKRRWRRHTIEREHRFIIPVQSREHHPVVEIILRGSKVRRGRLCERRGRARSEPAGVSSARNREILGRARVLVNLVEQGNCITCILCRSWGGENHSERASGTKHLCGIRGNNHAKPYCGDTIPDRRIRGDRSFNLAASLESDRFCRLPPVLRDRKLDGLQVISPNRLVSRHTCRSKQQPVPDQRLALGCCLIEKPSAVEGVRSIVCASAENYLLRGTVNADRVAAGRISLRIPCFLTFAARRRKKKRRSGNEADHSLHRVPAMSRRSSASAGPHVPGAYAGSVRAGWRSK